MNHSSIIDPFLFQIGRPQAIIPIDLSARIHRHLYPQCQPPSSPAQPVRLSHTHIHHSILTIKKHRHPWPGNNRPPLQPSRLDKHLRPLPQQEGYLPSTSPPCQHRPSRLTQRASQSTLLPKCLRRLPLLHRVSPRRRREGPRATQRRHARELPQGADYQRCRKEVEARVASDRGKALRGTFGTGEVPDGRG